MQLRRRDVDLWLHAALFSLYLGTVSVFGVTRRIDPALGSAAQLGLILLTWSLMLFAVWRSRRLPQGGLLLLALLPYAHMLYFSAAGEPAGGAFSYLYKFSGFLIAPYLWLWARHRDDRQIERTLMLLATLLAARAVLSFAAPGLTTTAGRFADDFTIYEWVGPLPRIFYPGMALVFYGLMVSLRNIFRAPDRQLSAETVRAVLFLAALAVNLSRGILMFAVLVTTLLLLVKFASARVAAVRKGRLVLTALLTVSGVSLLVVTTPLSDTLAQVAAGFSHQERFSLDQRNLDWRAQQVSAAFRLVETTEEQLLGVGTNTFIPESIEHPVPGEVTNELHYSYDSVRWTFGLLGLALLVGFGLLQPALRLALVRPPSPLLLPLVMTGGFIALVGIYTVVFTTADWSFVLSLCVAGVNARCDLWRRAPAPAARPARRLTVPGGFSHD
ncbi:O-antigen ligase family protein (plasmid) [Deinococcus taeanensis]|uniref:O-antigen ligase family protein n=1 Tax=Deinococcus taeanensis TaxID=2737050 RepID=UPI001CDBE5E1|nr:O-antigen ligase family protein [Deinococcus taeanensis]UBV44314.1 O-antigen ligase family protein [Deinococcus taeanensis]